MDLFKNLHSKNHNTRGQKRRFLFFGFINFLLTNVILQVLLIFIPVSLSTFISQLVNMILGLYLYGKIVFRSGSISRFIALKYLTLAIILWALNWSGINFLTYYGFSRNISALAILPLLVIFSFLCQKLLVFK